MFIPRIIGEESNTALPIVKVQDQEVVEEKELTNNQITKVEEEEKEPTVQELIELLSSNEATVRTKAVLDLSENKNPETVETLIKFLLNADNDPSIKYCAASALGLIGDPVAIDALVNAQDVNDPILRQYASFALLNLLKEDKKNKVLQEIRKKEEFTKTKIVNAISKLLDDEDVAVRCYAIEALGKINHPCTYQLIIDSLRDPESGVRFFTCDVLGKIQEPVAVNDLINCLNSDPDNEVKYHAAMALKNINNKDVIDSLFTCLINDDPIIRLYTVDAFSGITIDDLKIILAFTLLASDEDKYVRKEAKSAFHNASNSLVRKFLDRVIEDPNPESKLTIVKALGNVDDYRTVPYLIRLLTNEEEPALIRLHAQQILFNMSKVPLENGQSISENNEHEIVRIYAKEVLERMRLSSVDSSSNKIEDEKVLFYLIVTLIDYNYQLTRVSRDMLKNNDELTFKTINKYLLEDKNIENKLLLLGGIKELNDERLVPILVRLITNEEEDNAVRGTSQTVLFNLTKEVLFNGFNLCLTNENEMVRFYAELALGKIQFNPEENNTELQEVSH